jgi:hypothetical protein
VAGDAIRVEGLKEFRRELYNIGPQWTKEMRKVSLLIAEDIAEGTRQALGSQGGSAPKVVPKVKALAEQLRAMVKVGGGQGVGTDVAMGNLWGSSRYKQFPPRIAGGYALYPTLARKHDELEVRYQKMLDDLLKRAFPD